MKIGDKVRFLSETGGGRVAGFQSDKIVLVEDEDGFQIPVSVREVVVVDEDNYDSRQPATPSSAKAALPADGSNDEDNDYDPADREVTFRAPAYERKGGDVVSAYLAFVPLDIKELTRTRFEAYLINDGNYYLAYVIYRLENGAATLLQKGEIEPNTRLFIEEFGREELNGWEHLGVDLMAYKRDKSYLPKPAVSTRLRIDTVKFYKLHLFRENDFFDSPALLYTIVENDTTEEEPDIDPKRLQHEMTGPNKREEKTHDTYVRRYDNGKGNPLAGKKKDEDIVVVDLHAHELLDTTAGMSATDILNYQIETVRKTLEQYRNKKGQRIVFIHGKGEGVLRRAVVHELTYRYKSYPYQDASFQEYGYGATQVTVK